MSNDLLLEKRAQRVRVFLADGRVIPVTMFLVASSEGPLPGQAVAETVEESSPVLPCLSEEGDFFCVGTTAVSAISVQCRDTWDEGFFHLRRCHVSLRGGHELDGFLRHFLGAGDRLSDALRRTNEWIQLEVGSEVVWFRVEQLLTARELDPWDGNEGEPDPLTRSITPQSTQL